MKLTAESSAAWNAVVVTPEDPRILDPFDLISGRITLAILRGFILKPLTIHSWRAVSAVIAIISAHFNGNATFYWFIRAFLADRLALSLINRRQVDARGFTAAPTGGVHMDDETRKTLLVAYQKRKQEEIRHPFLDETTTVGLLLHLQARLLARYLRGDLDGYPPFIWK